MTKIGQKDLLRNYYTIYPLFYYADDEISGVLPYFRKKKTAWRPRKRIQAYGGCFFSLQQLPLLPLYTCIGNG